NTLEVDRWGIYGGDAYGTLEIHNNEVRQMGTEPGENEYWMLYISNNTDTVRVSNNTFISEDNAGVYIHDNNSTGTYLTFEDNTVDVQWNLMYIDNVMMDVRNNLLKNSSGYYGVQIQNTSGGFFWNNTIIGNSGEYGFWVDDYSNPEIVNNIVQGFDIGIKGDADLSLVSYNNFYDNTLYFTGDGLPDLFGELYSVNNNGDDSDVYGNISFDPNYADPENGDYTLSFPSPCINAGAPSLIDPDGTISDIGYMPFSVNVVIGHTPLGTTIDTDGPYAVTASASSPVGFDVTASVFYRVNSGDFIEVPMTDDGSGNFSADIPGQAMDSQVDYYISATDGENVATDPFGAPGQTHTFFVTLVENFSVLTAASNDDGSIELTWSVPNLAAGTLQSYNLYKSEEPGVTFGDLLLGLDVGTETYTDTYVSEGDVFYYRLSGTIDTGDGITTIFISEETSGLSDEAGTIFISGHV
ncbi:uncharacterized protein METZ01_LOCUS239576, partial [marine metagenome]